MNFVGNNQTFTIASGTTATVTGTGDTLIVGANASLTVSGSNDKLTLGSGDYVGLLGGSGFQITGSNDMIATWSNTSLQLSGGSDVLTLGASDYVGLLGGSNYTLTGSNDVIGTWSSTSLNISGSNDTLTLGNGDYVGVEGGAGLSLTGLGDTIATWANSSFTLSGGSDILQLGGGNYVGLLGGSGYSVSGTNDTIATWANTGFTVSGGNDNLMLNTGDYVGLLGGSGYSISGSNDTIATWANTSLSLTGSNDTLGLGAGDTVGFQSGSGYSVTGSNDTISTVANTSLNFSGGGSTLNLGSGTTINLSNSTGHFDFINTSQSRININGADVLASINGTSNNIQNNTGKIFINAIFTDASPTTSYETAVGLAISYFEAHITNSVVLNYQFGTSNLGAGALAENSQSLYTASYSTVANVLSANADTALPSINPFGTSSLWLTTAQAKALGLLVGNNAGIDDVITINSAQTFNYTQTNIQAGQYDAVSSLEHEMTEGMGRVDYGPSYLPTVEAFHIYSSPGQIDLTTTTNSGTQPYFSVDGGVTSLGPIGEQFGTGGGDIADWNNSGSSYFLDAFGYGYSGVLNPITSADVTEMEAIGYNMV